MKVSKGTVLQFEQEQKDFGTKVALENILILVCGQLLRDVGVQGYKLKYKTMPCYEIPKIEKRGGK